MENKKAKEILSVQQEYQEMRRQTAKKHVARVKGLSAAFHKKYQAEKEDLCQAHLEQQRSKDNTIKVLCSISVIFYILIMYIFNHVFVFYRSCRLYPNKTLPSLRVQ